MCFCLLCWFVCELYMYEYHRREGVRKGSKVWLVYFTDREWLSRERKDCKRNVQKLHKERGKWEERRE